MFVKTMFVKTIKTLVLAHALGLLENVTGQAYVDPAWWPLIQSTFVGENLQRCQKRNDFQKPLAPPNGMSCGSSRKTCFFGDQVCTGVPYPTTRCFCDGNTWMCAVVSCSDLAGPSTPNPAVTPTGKPTSQPTKPPTRQPTNVPTGGGPTGKPTSKPTVASQPTNSPSRFPTPLPTVRPTSAPTSVGPTFKPTSKPTVASQPTNSPTRFPTPLPTVRPTSAPTVGAVSSPTMAPTTAICPPLDTIMNNPAMSCSPNGLGCIFNFTNTTETERCNVSETCRCTASRFNCTVVKSCIPAPTCPALLDTLKANPTCTVPGFGCVYRYSNRVGTQVCTTMEKCDCLEAGAIDKFNCTIQSVNCTAAPTCPATPAIIAADPTCSSVGFRCNYTSVANQGSQLCTTIDTCECSQSLKYGCTSQVNCVPAPTCPLVSSPGLSCSAKGLSCNYTSVAPTPNGTSICTTVDSCTCGATSSKFECASKVSCQPVQACPTRSKIDLDNSCTTLGLGCTYNNVANQGNQICTTNERCNCTDTGFKCALQGQPVCAPSPTCPTFAAFQQDMTCSSPGLGCTFTYSNNTNTQLCTVTQACKCSNLGKFNCTLDSSCVPAPTCPTFAVIKQNQTCNFPTLGCTYNYSNNTGTQTCAIKETCTCGTNRFNCVAEVGACTANPPPLSCPSFDTFLTNKGCPGQGLKCTYSSAATKSDGSRCDRTDSCTCGANLQFGCTTNQNGTGC